MEGSNDCVTLTMQKRTNIMTYDTILKSSRTAILFVASRRLVLACGKRGVFLRGTFKADDLDRFLIDAFQIFRLETIQAAGADVCTNDLLHGFTTCFIQILERTEGV